MTKVAPLCSSKLAVDSWDTAGVLRASSMVSAILCFLVCTDLGPDCWMFWQQLPCFSLTFNIISIPEQTFRLHFIKRGVSQYWLLGRSTVHTPFSFFLPLIRRSSNIRFLPEPTTPEEHNRKAQLSQENCKLIQLSKEQIWYQEKSCGQGSNQQIYAEVWERKYYFLEHRMSVTWFWAWLCKKLHREWRALTKGRNEELKIFLLHRMFMYLLKRKTCLDYHTAYNPLLSFISDYLLTNFGARSHLFLVLAWKVLLSQIMPNLAKVISSSLS